MIMRNAKFKVGDEVLDSGRVLLITGIAETTYLYEVVGSSVTGGASIDYGNKNFKLRKEQKSKTMMHTKSEKTVIVNGDCTIVKIDPRYNLIEFNDMVDRISRKYYDLCGEVKGLATCAKEDQFHYATGEELAEARAWKATKHNYLQFLKYMKKELENMSEVMDATIEKTEKDIEHNKEFIKKFKDGQD